MDTKTYSLNSWSPKFAQRKFYQWVLKWMHGVDTCGDFNDEESNNDFQNAMNKPDVPTLATFFQAIGFKLLSFEKQSDADNKRLPELGIVRITIDCGTSNMKAVLELGDILCQCPDPDHVKDASFWSVSGTGPTASTDNISQKMEETGSNLLPRVSKGVTRILHDVTYQLFEIITNQSDLNRNTSTSLNASHTSNSSCERKSTKDDLNAPKEMGVVRSHTQPEFRLRVSSFGYSKKPCFSERKSTRSESSTGRNESASLCNKPILQRQRTWDIEIDNGSLDSEPRPSPPKMTSSPAVLAELSNSLGQISLQSDCENPKTLAECIVGAQKNLEKALKMLLVKKSPLNSTEQLNYQEEDTASVKSAPANMSPAHLRLNVLCSTKGSAKEAPAQNQKARRSIQATIAKSTTRRSMQPDQPNSKFPLKRRSLGGASNCSFSLVPKSLNSSNAIKIFGNINYNSTRNSSNSSNKIADEQPTCISPAPKSSNAPKPRTPSMIKPPTTITRPSNLKPLQLSKPNTGVTKKFKTGHSKE